MNFIKAVFTNVFAHPISTIYGCLQGAITSGLVAAVGAAATQFNTTGNVTDWKPYAAAAIAAGIPAALAGAARTDTQAGSQSTAVAVATQQVSVAIDAAMQAAAKSATDRAIAEIQKQINA